MRECFLCHKNGATDPLDRHHIFYGSYRKKSDKYGLTVYLCHHDCHIFGADSVHKNRQTDLAIKRYGQRLAMEQNDWSVEDFIREFGRNYIQEDTDDQQDDFTGEAHRRP